MPLTYSWDFPRAARSGSGGPGAGGAFALQFADNTVIGGSNTTAPFIAIQLLNPQLNGLPIWGAGGGGVTVIRKIKQLNSIGYMAQWWWSNNGSFLWDAGAPNSYWGMHPYPPGGAAGTSWVHEIASDRGGDYFNFAGSPDPGQGTAVTVNGSYLQGMQVSRAGVNDKTLTYYFNLPSTANGDKVSVNVTSASFGEVDPPSPAVTIGDSPWYSFFQHERAAMVLDAIKVFTPKLSDADMLLEAADMSRIVTSAGATNIWWGKNGFNTVDDLTCSFGTGRAFSWADTGNKGTLVARL